MSPVVLALVAGGAAAAALAWPYIRLSSGSAALSAADKAGWVNRLFVLAEAADIAGDPAVADQARALIAALVDQPAVAKKGK